jgi:aspartyl-tRNA(Asn)/glutamyl-tRNA(Gln) amidotransferase subunit C
MPGRDVMPAFGPDDIDRIAALAHLELTDDERITFGPQLAQILEYASEIQQVDTSGIEPTTTAVAMGARLREDRVAGSLGLEESVAPAPDADPAAGLFRVPRVISR